MDKTLLLHFSQAIYEISKEEDKVDEFYRELLLIDNALKDNQDFVEYLANPLVEFSLKEKSINNIFSSLDKSIYIFLMIVIKKHQIKYFSYIVSYYLNFSNIDKNILEGIVYSPFELKKEKLEELNALFTKKYKKNVYLKLIIDKKIIGGIKVNINDTLYDYSISSKIDDIKNKLSYQEK